jgi:hypothetical protein
MTAGVKIDPNTIYDDGDLVTNLGIASASLIRARREGQLRYRRVGHRALYLGRWLLEWFDAAYEARTPARQAEDADRLGEDPPTVGAEDCDADE